MKSRIWLCVAVIGLALADGTTRAETPLPAVVEFNRDIRPILSENCYACHGPDKKKRQADLRLDTEEDAFADLGGSKPLVPGKRDESELYRRVTADDDERMPPAKFGKRLTQRQINLIARWIDQGARWQKHWSLMPPQRPALPHVGARSGDRTSAQGWPANPIDYFVLARLEQDGLRPSPEADRRTLIRRLSFDLTGLPPRPEDVAAFLADRSPEAYEKLIDRLLASPHYGERMALYWLDLVRYADTGGYHSDNHRDVWLYRDYVIKAFNDNLPFDRFTVEQLAGDLLPGATREQRIASGYNRLLMTTEEGGAQAKEYQAKYMADRVRNVSSVWLGATLGCAECHNHKFDPFTTRDFYSLEAFFADLKERPVGRQEQTPMPTAEQAAMLWQLDEEIAAVQKTLATQTPELDAGVARWEETLRLPDVRRLPRPVLDVLLVEPGKRSPQQRQVLAAHYRTVAPELQKGRAQLAELQQQKAAFEKSIPTTLVSLSIPPRPIRILPRGNWLDDSGDVVNPNVPGSLSVAWAGVRAESRARAGSPDPARTRRATRLDLARWMVAPDNPVVARVFVNRLWKLMFGQGIVKTLDDFGSQGAWPTHPELLDWLAVEFRETGWNVKHLLKLLAMSRTYRQSSHAGPELTRRDPYNQLLARQGRFRLDAEMVRDNALAVSGLLNHEVGGPSVKPYQPAGYWSFLNFPRREWFADKGLEQYRRGLYTYWCRTFLQPSLLAFDASTREECVVERPRSNTPLQALVLLNDPTYVEAARAFAERIVREGGKDIGQRIQFAYRQALCRAARAEEVKLLRRLYEKHKKEYTADRTAASAVLTVGERQASKDLDGAELAAWASVARVILNLHETISRD